MTRMTLAALLGLTLIFPACHNDARIEDDDDQTEAEDDDASSPAATETPAAETSTPGDDSPTPAGDDDDTSSSPTPGDSPTPAGDDDDDDSTAPGDDDDASSSPTPEDTPAETPEDSPTPEPDPSPAPLVRYEAVTYQNGTWTMSGQFDAGEEQGLQRFSVYAFAEGEGAYGDAEYSLDAQPSGWTSFNVSDEEDMPPCGWNPERGQPYLDPNCVYVQYILSYHPLDPGFELPIIRNDVITRVDDSDYLKITGEWFADRSEQVRTFCTTIGPTGSASTEWGVGCANYNDEQPLGWTPFEIIVQEDTRSGCGYDAELGAPYVSRDCLSWWPLISYWSSVYVGPETERAP